MLDFLLVVVLDRDRNRCCTVAELLYGLLT